jgi:hypothetical protein
VARSVPADGVRWGQRSGRMARLGPMDRDMLILIPRLLDLRPHGDRGAVSLEGAAGATTRSGCACGPLRGGQGRAARVSRRPGPSHALTHNNVEAERMKS